MTVFMAYLIDVFIGDPSMIPHPVRGMGSLILLLEKCFYRVESSRRGARLRGALLVFITLVVVVLFVKIILLCLSKITPLGALLLEIWFISTTLAGKGLRDAALAVYRALLTGDMKKARLLVGKIVGRDTFDLTEEEVSRAAVETVAENTLDGITAPLFFAFIGGAPLAVAYRAVNTLDSMLGYKNDTYKDFGWAAAKLDDLLNYIPARLTAFLLALALILSPYNSKGAWEAVQADARKHPSPNSGFLEAGFAGALGITLGGVNRYGGIEFQQPLLGSGQRLIHHRDILAAVEIMQRVSLLFLLLGVIAQFLFPAVWIFPYIFS